MRKRYLDDMARVENEGAEPSSVLKKFKLVGDTAWQGKIALLRSDMKQFGSLMKENHKLVDEIMHECGFAHGAGAANNELIRTALESGALGGKLSGAGGGGSVLVLVEKSNEDEVVRAVEKRMKASGYSKGRVLRVSVDKKGLRVLDRSTT
jgi:galactokinase/mevalonate kinase-like predicted kinase